MIKLLQKMLFILGVFALVTACQTMPRHEGQASSKKPWLSDENYSSNLLARDISYWRYHAKISIKTESVKEAANLVWVYSDQSNQLRIFGPLGAGAIKLEFDRFGVELTDSKGIVHRGSNPEALIYDLLGWVIPINSMPSWLFGQPDLTAAFRYQNNEDNRVALINQSGWKIEYPNYRDYSGRVLPKKIKATGNKDSGIQGDVEVMLVSKGWSFVKNAR